MLFKSSKNKFYILGILILVLFSFIAIAVITNQQKMLTQQRFHIFCEILTTGMDKETVLKTLNQLGEFKNNLESERIYAKGYYYSRLYGQFTDANIAGKESVILTFKDGKYIGASQIIFLDTTESICNP
jgi:hypothetical protein